MFKCKWSGCKWKDKQVYSFGWLCLHVKGRHIKVSCSNFQLLVVLCLHSYRTIPFFLHNFENLMYAVILIVESLWKRTIMFWFRLSLNRTNFQFLILKVIKIHWDAHIHPPPPPLIIKFKARLPKSTGVLKFHSSSWAFMLPSMKILVLLLPRWFMALLYISLEISLTKHHRLHDEVPLQTDFSSTWCI